MELWAFWRARQRESSLAGFWQADTRKNTADAFELFVKTCEAKYAKATLCLQKDRYELLAFYDFPAQHWQSLRMNNPIESTFGTIRHRSKRSKGWQTQNRSATLYGGKVLPWENITVI